MCEEYAIIRVFHTEFGGTNTVMMQNAAGKASGAQPGLIRRFMSYYRPHKRLFMVDFGCAVVAGLLELGFPVAVQWVVGRLLPDGAWGRSSPPDAACSLYI